MTRTVLLAALPALLCSGAGAQTFEVASVKPSPPPDLTTGFVISRVDGGPGTGDPTRVDFRNMPLRSIIRRAYNLSDTQISGPDWIDVDHYDIAAKVAPGATPDEYRAMLRNLLAERFKMQAHRDKKELPVYSLTIARNGPKLKPHVETPAAADTDRPMPDTTVRVKTDSEGYPVLPPGIGIGMLNGKGAVHMDNTDLAPLVLRLAVQLGTPVIDDTGLRGRYDIRLRWVSRPPGVQPEADDPGPDLIAAVQEQLGLKLERKKGPVEVLVIDHLEKVPTGN